MTPTPLTGFDFTAGVGSFSIRPHRSFGMNNEFGENRYSIYDFLGSSMGFFTSFSDKLRHRFSSRPFHHIYKSFLLEMWLDSCDGPLRR